MDKVLITDFQPQFPCLSIAPWKLSLAPNSSPLAWVLVTVLSPCLPWPHPPTAGWTHLHKPQPLIEFVCLMAWILKTKIVCLSLFYAPWLHPNTWWSPVITNLDFATTLRSLPGTVDSQDLSQLVHYTTDYMMHVQTCRVSNHLPHRNVLQGRNPRTRE